MKNQMRRNFAKDEDAVSPVVGVILMVAITVILAAIIAAFVLGLGSPKKAPVASLKLVNAGTNWICIEHQGGDGIDFDTPTGVTVTVAGSAVSGQEVNATLTTAPGFTAGEISAVGTGSTIISAGGEVRLIDNVSQQAVATFRVVTIQTTYTCP